MLASGAAVRGGSQSPSTADALQTINVTAKKYEFNPSTIRVKQGTRVQLRITATDHTHGFKIADSPEGAAPQAKAGLVFPARQDCYRIQKGQTMTIDFTAQTPGTYRFKCCVHCGLHHGRMKGQLIVTP